MNDYRMIQGIKQILDESRILNQHKKGVFTHVPENCEPPYVCMGLEDISESQDRALVRLYVDVFSSYTGLFEVQSLLQEVKKSLDGIGIVGADQSTNQTYLGVVRVLSQKIEIVKEGPLRQGRTSLDILLRPLIGGVQ